MSGRILLFTDDVANIFGFLELLRFVKHGPTKAHRSRGLRFTTRAFARYLMKVYYCKHSRKSAVRSKPEMNALDECLLGTSVHRITKLKLYQFVAEPTQCTRFVECPSFTNEDLRSSLMDAYFAKLTRTYELDRTDFGLYCIIDVLLRPSAVSVPM